jgi:beta-lactamase class D
MLLCTSGCNSNKAVNNQQEGQDSEKSQEDLDTTTNGLSQKRSWVPALGSILDSNDVKGAILIYKKTSDTWVCNDYDWADKQRLPASTFKIVNSIIGLETGEVKSTGVEFLWDGKPRRLNQWEKDFDLKGAFHASCVPCYQELANRIGTKRMQQYLKVFDYGDMTVDSSSLDLFWLEGESGISQSEQVDFLIKFYNNDLPIDINTTNQMKRLMVIDSTADYVISGKTGWSIRNGNNNGWFVGYLEKGEDVYFFATNLIPNEAFNMDMFPRIRSAVTMEALRSLGVIE